VDFVVTADDACAGPIAPVCNPASGSFFALGSTPVECSATDPSGNVQTCSFVVTVREGDTTPPVVTCGPQVIAECQGPNGTVVTFQAPTALDNCDGVLPVSCTPASGSTFLLGETTVTCEAFDNKQNRGFCTFIVRVVDTVGPEMANCVDKTVCSTVPIAVTYEDVDALDLCGAASVVCVPPSGSTFQLGETTVTCTGTDAANNSSQCTFKVTVKGEAATISYTVNGDSMTLRWPKNDCYTLYYRGDLGTPGKASDLTWTLYDGTIVDEGTTMSATFQKNSGMRFFLLK
jgi:hypothetical protein